MQWYRLRIEQYLERADQDPQQAIQQLRSLPSSEMRNDLIDQVVDDHLRVHSLSHFLNTNTKANARQHAHSAGR